MAAETWTGIRYHVTRKDGKVVHEARMVAIEDKYGTVRWRCVTQDCGYTRPAKDEDEEASK